MGWDFFCWFFWAGQIVKKAQVKRKKEIAKSYKKTLYKAWAGRYNGQDKGNVWSQGTQNRQPVVLAPVAAGGQRRIRMRMGADSQDLGLIVGKKTEKVECPLFLYREELIILVESKKEDIENAEIFLTNIIGATD